MRRIASPHDLLAVAPATHIACSPHCRETCFAVRRFAGHWSPHDSV